MCEREKRWWCRCGRAVDRAILYPLKPSTHWNMSRMIRGRRPRLTFGCAIIAKARCNHSAEKAADAKSRSKRSNHARTQRMGANGKRDYSRVPMPPLVPPSQAGHPALPDLDWLRYVPLTLGSASVVQEHPPHRVRDLHTSEDTPLHGSVDLSDRPRPSDRLVTHSPG